MEGVDYFADVEPSELVPYLKIRDFISSLEQMVIKEVPSQAPHGLYEISNLIKDLGISPAIKVVDNLEDIFGEGGAPWGGKAPFNANKPEEVVSYIKDYIKGVF